MEIDTKCFLGLCHNIRDHMTLSEFEEEELAKNEIVFFRKERGDGSHVYMCYDREMLLASLEHNSRGFTNWVVDNSVFRMQDSEGQWRLSDGTVLEDDGMTYDGHGGKAGSKRFTKILESHSGGSMYITNVSVLENMRDTKPIFRLVAQEPTRIGAPNATLFSVSALHGQLPKKNVYTLESMPLQMFTQEAHNEGCDNYSRRGKAREETQRAAKRSREVEEERKSDAQKWLELKQSEEVLNAFTKFTVKWDLSNDDTTHRYVKSKWFNEVLQHTSTKNNLQFDRVAERKLKLDLFLRSEIASKGKQTQYSEQLLDEVRPTEKELYTIIMNLHQKTLVKQLTYVIAQRGLLSSSVVVKALLKRHPTALYVVASDKFDDAMIKEGLRNDYALVRILRTQLSWDQLRVAIRAAGSFAQLSLGVNQFTPELARKLVSSTTKLSSDDLVTIQEDYPSLITKKVVIASMTRTAKDLSSYEIFGRLFETPGELRDRILRMDNGDTPENIRFVRMLLPDMSEEMLDLKLRYMPFILSFVPPRRLTKQRVLQVLEAQPIFDLRNMRLPLSFWEDTAFVKRLVLAKPDLVLGDDPEPPSTSFVRSIRNGNLTRKEWERVVAYEMLYDPYEILSKVPEKYIDTNMLRHMIRHQKAHALDFIEDFHENMMDVNLARYAFQYAPQYLLANFPQYQPDLRDLFLHALRKNAALILAIHEDLVTEEMLLVAVSGDGMLLGQVNLSGIRDLDTLEHVQLAAVKENGLALKFIDVQTKTIQEAAVRQNPQAMMFFTS